MSVASSSTDELPGTGSCSFAATTSTIPNIDPSEKLRPEREEEECDDDSWSVNTVAAAVATPAVTAVAVAISVYSLLVSLPCQLVALATIHLALPKISFAYLSIIDLNDDDDDDDDLLVLVRNVM